MDTALLLNVIFVAIISSFSHCVGMCGGFALMLSSNLAKTRHKALFIALYHTARIFAYCLLGLCFGLFGQAVILSPSAKGFVLFVAGLFMVLFGLGLLVRGKLLAFIENARVSRFILGIGSKAKTLLNTRFQALYIVLLGFLNGLIPCGIVYYFLALSFSSGSAFESLLIMLIFGLCTLPALVLFSSFASALNAKFKSTASIAISVFIALYGLYLAFDGFMLI